ncbi:hypothetical protein D3C87_1320450 [compost metagenome]
MQVEQRLLLCGDARREGFRRRQRVLLQQRAAAQPDLVGLAPDTRRLILEVLLHAPIQLGAEQPLQNGLPRARIRRQQFAEAPLRQHDHLPELRAVEAEQVAHGIAHAVRLGRLAPPAIVHHHVQLRLGGLLDEAAGGTLARPVLRRRARHPVARGAQAEFQRDFRAQGRIGVGAAHVLGVALAAGGVAVQREADCIEQRGLARARGAVDQEERLIAQLCEVDGLRGRERAERLERQVQRFHADSLSAAAMSASRSSSVRR